MDVERFKQAIAIIEEIPDKKLNLRSWQRSYSNTEYLYISSMRHDTCGTIACAAGWLALHPDMQEQGLCTGHAGMPKYHDGIQWHRQFTALQYFFDLSVMDADYLFSSRTNREDEEFPEMTDKQIWLRRARNLLVREEVE